MITETFLSVALFEEASGDLSLYRWLSETKSKGGLIKRHDPGRLMKRLSKVDCVCVWFDEEASHRFLRQRTARSSYSQQTVSGNFEDSVELSSSQVPFLGSLGTEASNFDGDTAAERRERRKWTPNDDIVLIGLWSSTCVCGCHETVQACHARGDSASVSR
ncbi:hypothetical protein F2Q68_00024756 [Brassica cretica]|uniref:Uncharacterized protein n=1 Tax=Brassica cretica TaxID=69181 RepID=A0A8S9IE16_BRACR|nr:hypothetical protein F2Q68_00024756 [Brassica cretica]